MNKKPLTKLFVATALAVIVLTTSARGQSTGTYSVKAMPASIVKTVPEGCATDVDPGLKEVTVTFSKDMKPGTWSVCKSTPEENYPGTGDGPMHYLSDKRTCVMPVKLKPGRTYVLWFNRGQYQGFRDAGGMSSVPYMLVFETKK